MKEILNLFLYEHKLKFSEIEKALKIRSNKLAYHIKDLLKKGILIKSNEYYELSENSEKMIPFLSEKKSMLPVILIKIGNKSCFFYKRKKRPFKGQLSLPGGRPLLGESIKNAVKRIMKEKFNIDAKLTQIHSISIENLITNKIVQSDIIIFVSAITPEKLELIDYEKNKSEIISSDYFLIKKDSKKRLDIKTLNTTKI